MKIEHICLITLLFASGCVSMKTCHQREEASYHKGRKEIIKKVDSWVNEKDISRDDIKYLIDSLQAGELIWAVYFYRNPATE